MSLFEPRASRLRIEIAPVTIFLVLGVVAGVWMLGQLATVLSVVTIALVLVGTFDPVVAWLERRGLPRGRALVLVFVLATLALAGIVLLMVPPLLAQVVHMIETAPRGREQVIHSLTGYSWAKPLISAIKDLPIDHLSAKAGAAMIGYSTQLFTIIGYGISTLFLAIYLLADPARSKGLAYSIVPRHHHVKLARVLLELKVIVGGYMRGQLITSLAITVFVFLLLTILGADNALPIALFAGLTDIIPFVGGYIASTPVVIAVIPHGTTTAIIVGGLMVLYQEFESRILIPRVYGRVLRLPPAIVLVALLVGGTLAGILGALLALPMAAGLQMLIRELRVNLPGDVPASDETHRADEQAIEVYEHLSLGSTAADAGVIADGVASLVMRTEASAALKGAGADARDEPSPATGSHRALSSSHAEATSPVAPSGKLPRPPGTILIVDDDVDTAELVRDGLLKRGFDARTVHSARACLDELRDRPVDLVLTDVQMTEMSGIELCHVLHRDYPEILPIVVTGVAGLETAVAAVRAGAYDYITKPIKLDVLAIALERAMQHLSLGREVRRLRTEASAAAPPALIQGVRPAAEGTSPGILPTDPRLAERRP